MRYFVTGAAGFIGFHLANQLLEAGHEVIGLDNINDYYDPQIKHDRLAVLEPHAAFDFHKRDLEDSNAVMELIGDNRPDRVIHLAAQAGDVPNTWADCSELAEDFGYKPDTSVQEGIKRFVEWYRDYYDA